MSDIIIHDGKVLPVGKGEWAIVDAIEDYENKKQESIKKEAKKYADEVLIPVGEKTSYYTLQEERNMYKKMADNLYKACLELENENKELRKRV